MKKIMLLIDSSSEYDRRLLRGLVQFSKDNGPWIFYRLPSFFEKENIRKFIVDWARKWKADAIVGRWRWGDPDILSTLHIPIVLQNYHHRSEKFSNLTGAYSETGKIAADFFGERGYNEFAYFGVKGVVWSEERLEGYSKEIKARHGRLSSLMIEDALERNRKEIIAWLKSLPKPIAMFACDDEYALYIAETCKVENISIPKEIALLGVDNDELLCQISDPNISSIELDVEQGGYLLGQVLEKQFEMNKYWTFSIVVNPGKVVERNSTRMHDIKDRYVEKIVNYIDDNYSSFISTDDILQQVPLSRRSVEIRFKKAMGEKTIYQYLINCRVRKFAHLLSTSDLSIGEIAEKSGSENTANIVRQFKKIYGCSPQEYRKRMRQQK